LKEYTLTPHPIGLLGLSLAAILALGGCERKDVASDTAGDKAPAAQARPVAIGVSLLNLSSEFIVMLNRAMESKAKELGVRLIVNDAQRSAERQVQQIENFVAQKVDAIILNPCEVEASSPAVDRALAAVLILTVVAAGGR